LENEPAPFAQRHDLFHFCCRGRIGHKRRNHPVEAARDAREIGITDPSSSNKASEAPDALRGRLA
jgi:hypothetical protein